MPDILIDTTVLIDAVNKQAKALDYVEELLHLDMAVTHGQAAAEVLEGTRNAREQIRLLRFLRQFRFVHSNELDSTAALQFLTRFHLSHDLGFGDCMIGATALRMDMPVATLNARDFRLFPGLIVIVPY